MEHGSYPRMTLRTAAHRLRITQEEAREAEDAALEKIGRELIAALNLTPDQATDRHLLPSGYSL